VHTDLTFKTSSGDLVLHGIRESSGYVSWVLSYYVSYNTANQLQIHFMCGRCRYNKRKYSIMAEILEFSPHHIMY